MKKTILTAAMATSLVFAGAAMSQGAPAQQQPAPQPQPMPQQQAPQQAPQMTTETLKTALEQVGYTEVEKVEIASTAWTAEADNREGERVEVMVDPATARIVSETAVEN